MNPQDYILFCVLLFFAFIIWILWNTCDRLINVNLNVNSNHYKHL
jgi:hypothetical protein